MISSFDKNGAAKHYRREFIQNVNDCDYEGALDNLLKYHDTVHNRDFHLACGILYFLMSQDSDDNELLVMAAREFMMHLRRFPTSRVAFRDLLGVHMLRHDPAATLACADWAALHGFDIDGMFGELSEAGVELFMDESDGLDLDGLLEKGEFGEIDIQPTNEEAGGDNAVPAKERHIIQFRGGKNGGDKDARVEGLSRDKILAMTPSEAQTEFRDDWNGDVFDAPDEIDDGEDFTEDVSRELIDRLRDGDMRGNSDMATQLALQKAEQLCGNGDFESALGILAAIKPSDGRYYYCAECMRAFIFAETGDLDGAMRAVNRAFEVLPHGALASTLLCKIYEDKKQFDKIPDALKNADVKDYTDAGHVYQAMRLAIEYCTPEDALSLAEDYIEEFNTMDIRMLYAQMLYNHGDRKAALREMYKLTRIFYDDFNTHYYYKNAVLGVKSMPVDEDAPQTVLATAVNAFVLINKQGLPDDETVKGEMYDSYLELFLTLQYPREKQTSVAMFELLGRLVEDGRLEEKLRDALVSPYVEPLVKAVILSGLLKSGQDDYLMSISFCPITGKAFKPPTNGFSDGFKTAFAFTVALAHKLVPSFNELAVKLKSKLDASEFSERDKAYYILQKLKSSRGGKKISDSRTCFALGYGSKSEAAQAFAAVDAYIGQI